MQVSGWELSYISEITYSWIQSWTLSFWSTHALLRSTYQDYQAAIQLSECQLCHPTFFLLLPSLAPAFVCWFPLPPHTLKSFLRWFILLTQWKTIFFFWSRWGMTKRMFHRTGGLNSLTGTKETKPNWKQNKKKKHNHYSFEEDKVLLFQ